jgi:hypothetical protein
MDKKIAVLATIIVVLAVIMTYNIYNVITAKQTIVENNLPEKVKDIVASQMAAEKASPEVSPSPFSPPLERAEERITKKPFGIFIAPQNSPVRPERFRGFHTGTDFEIFPDELDADVLAAAVCDGKIAQKKYASGYGGLLVESCELDGQPVTVVYGHLKLASIAKKAGDTLAKREEIGILGKNFSAETSGERKHLHLGIHRGSSVDIRGYVSKEADLSGWVDPCSLDSICE